MDLLLFRDRPRPYIPPGSLFKTLIHGGRGGGASGNYRRVVVLALFLPAKLVPYILESIKVIQIGNINFVNNVVLNIILVRNIFKSFH